MNIMTFLIFHKDIQIIKTCFRNQHEWKDWTIMRFSSWSITTNIL